MTTRIRFAAAAAAAALAMGPAARAAVLINNDFDASSTAIMYTYVYGGGTPDTLVEFHPTFTYGSAGGYQHFSGTMAGAPIAAGSLANLQAYAGVVNRVAFVIAGDWYGSGNVFGAKPGSTMTIDNVLVQENTTPIPEPASLGLGALALLRRR